MLLRMAGRNRVAEILMQAGLIDELQLRSALGHLNQWGGRLGHALVEKQFASEEAVVDALAAALHAERLMLGSLARDAAALSKLDAEFCRDKGVFPVHVRDGGKTLLLAMADPTDGEAIQDVTRRTRMRVVPGIAGEGEIRAAIDRLYLGKEPAPRPPSKVSMNRVPESPRPGPPVLQPARAANPAPAAAAGDALDELLDAGPASFDEEAMARLRSIIDNQQKSGRILRALTELLVEKGQISAAELAARNKS